MANDVFEKNKSYVFESYDNGKVYILLECKDITPFPKGDITIFKYGKISKYFDQRIDLEQKEWQNEPILRINGFSYLMQEMKTFDGVVSATEVFSQHVKDYLSNSSFLNVGEKITFPAWYLFGLEYYNGVIYIEAKDNGKYDVAVIKNVALDSTPVEYFDCYVSYHTDEFEQTFGIFDNNLKQIVNASCERIPSTEIGNPESYQQFLKDMSLKKERNIVDICSLGIKFAYENGNDKIIVENVGEDKYNLSYYHNVFSPNDNRKEEINGLNLNDLLYKLVGFGIIDNIIDDRKDDRAKLSFLAENSRKIDSIEMEIKGTNDLRAKLLQPFAFMEKGKIYAYEYEYSNSSHNWKKTIALRCLGDGLFDVCLFDFSSSFGYDEGCLTNEPASGGLECIKKAISQCKILVNYDTRQIEFYDPNTLEVLYKVGIGYEAIGLTHNFEEQASDSWIATLEVFNREFNEHLEKSKKIVKTGNYLDNMRTLFFDDRLMINLVYSEDSSYSSTVAYRPTSNGCEPYFNNETSEYKSWYGLNSLIELLRKCVKHYDYADGDKLLNVVDDSKEKLANWLSAVHKCADNGFSEGEQLGQNYINSIKEAVAGLIKHVDSTQQSSNVYIGDSYSSEFYDNKYESSLYWPRPLEQLKNGIQKLEELFPQFSKSYDNISFSINCNDAEANRNFEHLLSEWKKEEQNKGVPQEEVDSIVSVTPPQQESINFLNNKILNALFKAAANGKRRINELINKYFSSNDKSMSGGNL